MKKILIFILLLLSFAGCKKKTVNETVFIVNNNVPSQTTVSEFSFEMITCTVIYPDGKEETIALDKSMLFQSDIEKLKTVGEHIITVNYKTFKKIITITLLEDRIPQSIIIEGESSVKKGETITLHASINPPNSLQDVIWLSLTPQIATVNNGVVTGINEGDAIIRVQSFFDSLLFLDYHITVLGTNSYEEYYQGAEGLKGTALKAFLHEKINDHRSYSYDFALTALRKTDEDPANSDNLILFYTGRSQGKYTNGSSGDSWNREHIWPKSHGDFGTSQPMGTDLHNLRPTDASVNSTRGNLDFDNGGAKVIDTYGLGSSFCYVDTDSFEPRNEVKGDVARIIFYMAVRYEGGKVNEKDLELVDSVSSRGATLGKLSTLLAWNEQDPVDDFERNRNEVIYGYQNNRNPFIDHPEFASLIWNHLSIKEEFNVIVYQIICEFEKKGDYILI